MYEKKFDRQIREKFMNQAEGYPKEWNYFLEKEVFENSWSMVIEKIAPKKYKGKCQRCGMKDIPLANISHLGVGNCPECGQRITYKNGK